MVVKKSNLDVFRKSFPDASLPFFIAINDAEWNTAITIYHLENV